MGAFAIAGTCIVLTKFDCCSAGTAAAAGAAESVAINEFTDFASF